MLFLLAVLLILAWKNAGYIGLDHYLGVQRQIDIQRPAAREK